MNSTLFNPHEPILAEKINEFVKRKSIEIPEYIIDNLGATLRPYQEITLQHFLFYEKDQIFRTYPTHLLFHMATGSGKTLIMAALIVHLYKQGYNNFLFFVNSANIIEKTKENFLNKLSNKYLFTDSIKIDGERVHIREVNNFDEAVAGNINIHFTTIQGLHSRLKKPGENSVTYEDFIDKEIVLISDEAHHLNTLTKKNRLNQAELNLKNSWEYTIQEIFSANRNNFLLDFTATMDLQNQNIAEKYNDKIVYDYPLKKFRLDGYSKDIELRQTQADIKDKMFHAIIFSQYRRKLAEKHDMQIKPVILMKSKRIASSEENTDTFIQLINNLSGGYIEKARGESVNDHDLKKMYDYFFDELELSYDNFALELKEDFSDDKIINVNNDGELKNCQIKINSLEDYNNEIRVIFAVNKLNEGWDVLNLFDIVRLYDTRDAGKNKIGTTTMAEAQLIGRGARYYPFIAPDYPDEEAEKRKYDKDADNPLRILEELYYHCSHNPQYISEIKLALQETGMLDEPEKINLKLKISFLKTEFYKKGVIYINKQIKNKNTDKKSLNDYEVSSFYKYNKTMSSMSSTESALTDNKKRTGTKNLTSKTYKIEEKFNKAILRRVADGITFFHFDNIQKFLPYIESMNELFESISDYNIEITGDRDKLFNLSKAEQKDILHFVFRQIEAKVKSNSTKYRGSDDFYPVLVQDVVVDKMIKVNNTNQLIGYGGDWYVYEENALNGLEKDFVKYIKERKEQIRRTYGEFYLIRNERFVKLYNFADGGGFEPDFLLFLTNKNKQGGEKVIYQLFIEPKGEHIYAGDKWKEDFLKSLNLEYKAILYSNRKYNIIGLPFYREGSRSKFEVEFEKLLKE